jgi:hypothetical protein
MSKLSEEFHSWFNSVKWKTSNEEELKKWKGIAALAFYEGWKRGVDDGVDAAVDAAEKKIDGMRFPLD